MTYGLEWSRTQAGLWKLFVRAAYTGDPELAERLVVPIADAMRHTITTLLAQATQRGELRSGLDIEATGRLVHALLVAAGDAQLFPYLNHYFQIVSDDITPERSLNALVDLIYVG